VKFVASEDGAPGCESGLAEARYAHAAKAGEMRRSVRKIDFILKNVGDLPENY
jgi:hypothetical protein